MYTLQAIPEKGNGLVASEPIPRGTRILCEQPIVTTPDSPKSEEWLKSHISQQVDSLTHSHRQSFLSLHNLYPYKDASEGYLGIIQTNGLPIEANGIKGGIFLSACRINHSCDNNAQKNWNKRIQRHTIHALRDIPKDEEITIYYLNHDSSRRSRRQRLQEKFGFICSCRLCSLSDTESQESDERLSRIDYLDDVVGRECEARNFSQRILGYVDERVRLYERQGPGNSGLPRAYLDAAQIAIANGDLARGRVFAERAVEGWRIAYGSDSDDVVRFTSLAKDPSSLSLYGTSMKWKTSMEDIPQDLDTPGFEDWLWRRKRTPNQQGRSGRGLTHLRNRDFFPKFDSLPADSRSGLDEAPSHPWCFLGEITDSMAFLNLELRLTDIDGKIIPLHFDTAPRGGEIAPAQIQNGYTVAVLYAKRHVFMYGDPGIKLADLEMLKIFPVSLCKLLELSGSLQQFSVEDETGMRMCHGCGKKTASSSRCGRCGLFWYCDNDCQRTGWNEKGHKADCKLLKDPDLRGLFVLRWDELNTTVRFPITIPAAG